MNAQTFIAKTQSIFSDNAGVRKVGRQSSGPMVDEGRLAMLGAGDLRVFARKQARQFKAWRVEILVDCSGSVYRDNRAEALVETVTNIVPALRAAQVGHVEVRGMNRDEVDLTEELKDKESFLNLMAAAHGRGSHKKIVQKNGKSSGGGTHDGYLIRQALKRLIAAREPGKMLLVFTDGDPACDFANETPCGFAGCLSNGSGDLHGKAALKADLMKAISDGRKAGLIVLAVGIQAEHVKGFYGERNCESVNQIGELFKKTAMLVERHLIRG